MPAGAPQIGGAAPPFELETPHGVKVSLTACLVEGPVLLEFLRGTWDPDARRRIAELASARDELARRRAKILCITCERRDSAAGYLERFPTPLALLLDEERRVSRAYGVYQRFTLPVWKIARPASFLVDRCGFVRHVFIARLPIHAASLEEIVRVLETL